MIEDQRIEMRAKLLAEIEPAEIRPGIVKNLASFGAFVDLGGIDGLLHVADMAWHRVERPKMSSGSTKKSRSMSSRSTKRRKRSASASSKKRRVPGWEWRSVTRSAAAIRAKSAISLRLALFVKLESGVEGLVHISEMSWTKRIAIPVKSSIPAIKSK